MTDLTIISELERRVLDLEETTRDLQSKVLALHKKAAEPKRVKGLKSAAQPANKDTWHEYCRAFHRRYTVKPIPGVRNNSMIKQLVTRVGHENAVKLVVFYLSQGDAFYKTNCHNLGLLVKDCETLMVKMQTGKRMTYRQAKKEEDSEANASVQSDYLRRKHGA